MTLSLWEFRYIKHVHGSLHLRGQGTTYQFQDLVTRLDLQFYSYETAVNKHKNEKFHRCNIIYFYRKTSFNENVIYITQGKLFAKQELIRRSAIHVAKNET